jgi:formate-dependent nitrite reductase membrane component NrfD
VTRERERALVPEADPRSYYGQPVIKEPVWTWEIPVYFFTGGLSGAGCGLAYLAELRGNKVLARRSWGIALGAGAVSPILLISDLGKPTRFLNMLRVFKVTSPMSVGSWILALVGAAATVSAANTLGGFFPRLAKTAKPTAAVAGMPLSTYTATLVSNTSVPVWHEARLSLPFLFAGGAAASAGAAATMATPAKHAAPARRLALLGAAAELVATRVMEQQLGELGEPYHEGRAGAFSRIAQLLTGLGGMTLAGFARRNRPAALAGAGALLAGAFLERWAVYKAGFQSASDPKYTVGPQRERVRAAA